MSVSHNAAIVKENEVSQIGHLIKFQSQISVSVERWGGETRLCDGCNMQLSFAF